MTVKEIKDFRARVAELIDSRRLREAFAEIADMGHRRMAWEVTDRLGEAEKSYAYMLSYVARGVVDPERDAVYESIVTELYNALDMLVRFMEKNESPTLYYNTVRTTQLPNRRLNIPVLMRELAQALERTSIFATPEREQQPSESDEAYKKVDEIRRKLFAAIWTAYPLSQADTDAILAALSDPAFPADMRCHVLSAVTLGLWQFFDRRRMEILARVYLSDKDMTVSSAALVGLLLGLWKYRGRPLDKKVADILATVKDKETWSADLRTAFIEMIRARDTERINRKMMDEVIPKMMDLRPDIMNKIRNGEINPDDPASIQENPEWQDMLDRSGITDRLKELTEIQQEGGDVFMSTFSHLKNFPFFADISNWFLPFSPTTPEVIDAMRRFGVLAEMVDQAVYLCDSDKYSFVLALQMLPEQQRTMMTSQLRAQREALGDEAIALGIEGPDRRRAVNVYMQNIYRFFKIYGRRSEFEDPFLTGINLINVPSLQGDFTDIDMLQVVAEFYFKLGYYEDAMGVYRRLDDILPGDAQRYQKMGYCAEKTGQIDLAIEYYQRAELLDSSSRWTLRRLAACYRAARRTDEALRSYQRLASMDPDNLNVALQLGYVLTEKGDYKEAVHQFYKVEFLDEKSTKAWRPLAWTLFLTGDYDASQRYYTKVLSDNPTAVDYLNMGHAAAASGNLRDAINYYQLSLQSSGGDRTKFLHDLMADADTLVRAGLSRETVALLADTVFYSMDK